LAADACYEEGPKEDAMPARAIVIGLAAAMLGLAPGHAAAQLPMMVGAGHRTDRTPLDREANNIPEPVSAEAEGERSPYLLTHPKPKPRVLLGPIRAAAAAPPEAVASLRVVVPASGYSTDPVPSKDDPRRGQERRNAGLD
jgi:hypothetical protein